MVFFLFKNIWNRGMIEKIPWRFFMKYMKQIAIIATISFIAELLYYFIPLPIPASVYGLVILFLLLCLKVVKLSQVENVADFLISIMPLFFIAPSVGLMESFDSIKGQVLPLVFICFVSTVVVTVCTGWIAQIMVRIRRKNERRKKNE